jgi:hypothetical protein
MSLADISAIAEIVGAIAIVATLIYLAVQLRQNTNALVANSRGTTMMADITLLTAAINYPMSVYGEEDLSVEQQRQFEMFLAMYLRIREFAWFQYQSGVLDKETFAAYMAPTKRQLSTPQSQKIWALFTNELDPGFIAYVDELLKSP